MEEKEARAAHRARMANLHGEMIVRIVERMMGFRVARGKHIIDTGGKDFDAFPEHLDRYAEAKAIAAIVQAAKLAELPREYDSQRKIGEEGAFFRLYELSEGHALTVRDVMDIEALLAEHNDEIGNQADKAAAWRADALREIGGDELVKAVEAKDEATTKRAVRGALARLDAARLAKGEKPLSLAGRIESYLNDMPSDGGHSDAAGGNCWELLREAMEELRS